MAATIELDGSRGDDTADSYAEVGRFIVRNCDLLIAVWDGRPDTGLTFTRDTVHFALSVGVPMWWTARTAPNRRGCWTGHCTFATQSRRAPRKRRRRHYNSGWSRPFCCRARAIRCAPVRLSARRIICVVCATITQRH